MIYPHHVSMIPSSLLDMITYHLSDSHLFTARLLLDRVVKHYVEENLKRLSDYIFCP